ncbi:right-handed parallel beta-helix repeat-containing protein [Thalassoglobus sp. JC818]|uniref:right-handed parallel beta-helix repeat-containing protein n=1 Tax=Thalassoglobus sp. JC818 TaxID=3232136 RepID=UPI003457EA45
MQWTRRVGLLCLCLLPWSTVGVAQGQDQITTSDGGVVFLDDVSGSMALSSDGGNYILFQKMIGDGPGFADGYSRIGVRTRLWEPGADHIFGELHALITDGGQVGFNVGGGYRTPMRNGLIGIHGWFDDYETSYENRYRQFTTGLEYLSPFFDVRANGYIPVGDESNMLAVSGFSNNPYFNGNNIVTDATGRIERSLAGWDLEAGGPVPGAMNWLRGYAGIYQLSHDNDSTVGFRGRAEARFMEGVNLNLVVSEDDEFGTNVNLGVEVRFRGTMPTRFESGLMADRRYDQVRRVWPIQTTVETEDVVVPLSNPGTSNAIDIVWVDNTNGAGGNGSFENPFDQLPGMADGADLILVRRGAGETLGNIALLDNQQMFGEGKQHFIDTEELGVIPLPDTFDSTGAAPILREGTDLLPIISLANNNVISSFQLRGMTGIAGDGVENFLIDSISSDDVLDGITIANASGFGTLSNIDLQLRDDGIGVYVVSAPGEPLALDVDNVTVAGGETGVAFVGDSSDLMADIDDVIVSGTTGTALGLAGFSSDLSATLDGVIVSNNDGNGVEILLSDATGSVIADGLVASDNSGDGVQIVAGDGSDFGVAIVDSTIDRNGDDNIATTVLDGSTLDLLVDPTSLVEAGDNAFEFVVASGSTLNSLFEDVDMSGSVDNAIAGSVTNHSTANLDFVNFDASGSGEDGLAMMVNNQSNVVANFTNGTFDDSGNSAVNVESGGNSMVDVNFTDVTADNLASDGNVILRSDNEGELQVNWIRGSISNGDATGVTVQSVGGGSQVGVLFNDVAINNNAGDGIDARLTSGGDGSILDLMLVDTTLQGNGEDGLDYQIAGNGATGMIVLDGVQATGNGMDGFQFDVTSRATLSAATAEDSVNDFSNNLGNAFQGTVSGIGSTAMVQISGAPATGSGEEGALFTNSAGGTLVFDYTDGSLSFSGEDGLSVDTSGANSHTMINLTDVGLNDNGQVNATSGDGLTATARNNGRIDLNLDTVSSATNAEKGLNLEATSNGQLHVTSSEMLVQNNGEEGLAFEALSGGDLTILNTTSTFANNGQSGSLSGIRGQVSSAGSSSSVSFENTLVDSNSGAGISVDVADGGAFIGELLSSIDDTGNMEITGNNGNGVELNATGSDTMAALIMTGPNDVSGNNGSGVSVTGADIDQLAVLVSGNIDGNNGHGISVEATDVTNLAVDVNSDSGTTTTSGNLGDGFNLVLDNVGLMSDIEVTTLTQTVTVGGLNVNDLETSGNLGHGLDITGSNLNIETLELSNVVSTLNMFDGIHIDLTDSSVTNMNILDSVASVNTGNGMRMDLDNTPIENLNVVGNTFGILPGSTANPSAPIDDSLPLIRNGFDFNTLPANDDLSTGLIPLGFDANFFGQLFDSAFVNNNGNITFDAPLGTFTPFGLEGTSRQIIAPFFADVDTRADSNGAMSGEVTFGQGIVNGRQAFGVNWLDVRHFSVTGTNNGLPTNSFQLILVDRSDIRPGDFDIEFNYGEILWEAGEASGSDAFGLGGSAARVGYSNGVDTSFELAGSGINGAFLDSGPAATSLVQNSLESMHDGRYIFFSRDGSIGGEVSGVGNGGDGFQLNAGNGSHIQSLNISENDVESNNSRGISISATDSDVGGLGGGTIELNNVSNNLSGGIVLEFDGSRLDDMRMAMNTVMSNGSDGILLDFVDSPVTNLEIVDHPDINMNGRDGISLQMDNSDINGLLIENNGMGTLMPTPANEFDITLNFSGGLTPSQQLLFRQAELRWEQIITDDLLDVGLIDDLVIDASGIPIDGVNGILGQAGPTGLRGGSFLPFQGIMQFDTADLAEREAAGQLDEIILHEMGHVLGIGTIWNNLGLVSGSGTNDPRFTGTNSIDAYNALFGLTETSVPLENIGGAGTVESHWRESVFDNELMTGYLNDEVPNPLSVLTIQSLADIGYVVDANVADTYPSPAVLAAVTGGSASVEADDEIVMRPDSVVADMDNLEALYGDMPALAVGPGALASLQMNEGHGINIGLTNSDLTGGVISGNVITDHANGDAFRMLNPTTNGNTIELDFTGNTFGSNGGRGINIALDGNESLVTTMTDNTIAFHGGRGISLDLSDSSSVEVNDFSRNNLDGNNSFGLRIDAKDNTNVVFDAGAGSDDTDLNIISNNVNAGIGISLSQNATGDLRITNTNISATRSGADPDFGAEGLNIQLTDNASAPNLTIGHESVANTTFSGNTGSGILISSDLSSSLANPTIQFVDSTLNNVDGLRFERFGSAVVDNVTITNSVFNSNLSDGIDIVASQGDMTDEFTIVQNIMSQNAGRGLAMEAQFDASIEALVEDNQIENNGGDGVELNQMTVSMDDAPSITADFIDNDIVFNGGYGIDVNATHQLTFDGNVIDNNELGGIRFNAESLNPGETITMTGGSASGNNGDGITAMNVDVNFEFVNMDISNNTGNGIRTQNTGRDVLVTGSTIDGNGQSGILVGNTGGRIDILNNSIDGNGTNGITNLVGVNSTISGNSIDSNDAHGVVLVGGTHTITDNTMSLNADKGVSIIGGTHTISGNMLEMNGGDALQMISEPGQNLTANIDDNTFRENGGRGIDLLVRGSTTADVTITNSLVEGNNLEGVYVVNTADLAQSADALATAALAAAGDPMANPVLEFDFDNNIVMDNGLNSGFAGSGLVMRVGTSGATTDFSNNGGFVSDGAGNLTGRGGVLANVTNSSFIGQPGADVLIESFVSTTTPAATTGTWDAATFNVTSFVQDPLSRIDLVFTGNTGDDIDIVRAGASFSNDESVFKSRTDAQPTAGPFTSGTRLRNAQRLASRSGAFAIPGATGASDTFLYSGVGGSTFRVSGGSTTAGFNNGDSFGDTVNLGAGIGELPFGWGSF